MVMASDKIKEIERVIIDEDDKPIKMVGKEPIEMPANEETKAPWYVPIYHRIIQPTIEGLGMGIGGVIGAAATAGPWGAIPGAALGYGITKKGGEILGRGLDVMAGREVGEAPGVVEETLRSAKDIGMGATMEMGGQLIGKAIPIVWKYGGKIAKQGIGRFTGTGTRAAEEAIKSGQSAKGLNPFKSQTNFDKAMRGQLSGEDVVSLARKGLVDIKNIRTAKYQAALKEIEKEAGSKPIDIQPIADHLKSLMDQYNIKTVLQSDGTILVNAERVAMGKKGIKDIQEIVDIVGNWGRYPEDYTITGIDTLKRQLHDFWSESSQARQFVASLENVVKKTGTDAVPKYAEQLKGYEEATRLIKDLEAGLMMRKQGMTGRIVSDQTLRRLISAMKDNFELRGDLLQILTQQGGEDVMGAVAGYSMSSLLPRGLAGTGPMIVGNVALAKLVNPIFWPIVAASSPRVSGEFLRVLGKYAGGKAAIIADPAGKVLGYGIFSETLGNLIPEARQE